MNSIKILLQAFNTILFRNAFYIALTQGLGTVIGFLFWFVVARLYTPSDVGLGSALIAALSLSVVVSGIGFDFGLVRFLPSEKNKSRMISTCLWVAVLTSFIFSLLFIVVIPFFIPILIFVYNNIYCLLSFILFAIVYSLLHMQRGVFQALRDTKYYFIQDFLLNLLKLILAILFASLGAWGIFLSMGVGGVLALFISFPVLIWIFKYKPTICFDLSIIRRLFGYSFGNYVSWIFSALPARLLPLMTISLLGSEMTAYFKISWQISTVIGMTIVSSVCASLFIEGSYEPKNLRKNTIVSIGLILATIIPVAIIIFTFADKILLIFGKVYSEKATDILRLFVISNVVSVIPAVYITIKRVQMQIRVIILLSLINTILILTLCYILAIYIGLTGIGLGYLLAQFCVLVVTCLLMIKDRTILSLKRILWHP